MNDDAVKKNAPPDAGKEKQPFQIARDRRGGVSKDVAERNRQQAAIRRKIIASLKEGAKTAPELAAATGLSTQDAFWWLMALRKYGIVAEAGTGGSYVKYQLKEGDGKKE